MKKAVVVGSGIAGPAAALFLRRIGWDVEVLEAAESPGGESGALDSTVDSGAFLNVAANGQVVLRELGLLERLRTQAHPAPRMVIWSGRGKRLGEVPNGPAGHPGRGGAVVRRAWLHQVLVEAVRDAGIPVATGVRVSDIRVEGSNPAAITAEGREFAGDLVVGADGVGSVVRRYVDPDAPAPAYTGLVGLGGFADGTGLAPTPDTQHFVFGRRSFFGYLVREDGTVYWFGNLTHPEASRAELQSVPAREWLERLRDLHRDDLHPVPEILAAADDTVGAYGIYDLASVPRWHRNAVVLIGDAVHAIDPSAGQGASLALEDAQSLAQALRDAPSVPSALGTFHRLRADRVERVVRYAHQIGQRKKVSRSRIAMTIRDLMVPIFLRRAAVDSSNNWLFDGTVEWNERLDGPTGAATGRTARLR